MATGKPCKRGNIAERDRFGHCLCVDCKAAIADYRRRTRAQKRASVREWRRRNPDKVKAYSSKWLAANRKQRRAIERDWRGRNPDKVRAMNARGGAKWSAGIGRGKRNALTRGRAAARLQRTPPWADLTAIQAMYDQAVRVTAETGVPHEVDHVLPLQGKTVSGLHVAANLQIITRTHNRAKHNRT